MRINDCTANNLHLTAKNYWELKLAETLEGILKLCYDKASVGSFSTKIRLELETEDAFTYLEQYISKKGFTVDVISTENCLVKYFKIYWSYPN